MTRLLARRWAALLALSLLLAGLLELMGLPAALFLGPLAAAIVLATKGMAVGVSWRAFVGAQGVVGVMIASNLPRSIFVEIAADWPIFLLGTLSTLIAAGVLGWLLTRSRVLPGTTAIWGSSPGAATAMVLMSESYGADLRLVALMQYTRVACCAVVAALVARLLGTPAVAHAAAVTEAWSWPGLAGTLGIAIAGAALGAWLRLPGGALLLPMALGMAAKFTDSLVLVLPWPLLVAAYAVLGWGIGMRFTREVLAHATRAFPQVIASILALIAVCGGFAGLLVLLADVDPVTAYLAASPGGADSVSIIAAATQVDLPFVVAMQVARFLVVLVTGPAVARLLSRHSLRKRVGTTAPAQRQIADP